MLVHNKIIDIDFFYENPIIFQLRVQQQNILDTSQKLKSSGIYCVS